MIASKQYSSEARFTLRVGRTAEMDSLGSLTGLPSMEMAQDTYIVINYIQSRAIIEDIERKLDLHAIYSRPGSDWYYRFNPKKPIEKFVSYWKSMIDVSVQMPGGIVPGDRPCLLAARRAQSRGRGGKREREARQ